MVRVSMKQVFLPLLREKRCDVVALRSCQRDVTHQYIQIQNGGTETMKLIQKCMFFFFLKAFGRNIGIE